MGGGAARRGEGGPGVAGRTQGQSRAGPSDRFAKASKCQLILSCLIGSQKRKLKAALEAASRRSAHELALAEAVSADLDFFSKAIARHSRELSSPSLLSATN